MPEDLKDVYTKDEHLAILADRVSRETASMQTKVDELTTENTELKNKLDVAESGKVAAEQAKATVEQEFTTYKTEVEQREVAASRKDSRIAEIKDKAAHLPEDWFTAEGRVERIIAMEDEAFATYLSDLAASAPAGVGDGRTSTPPRESAMAGQQLGGTESLSSAGRSFLLRDYEKQEA